MKKKKNKEKKNEEQKNHLGRGGDGLHTKRGFWQFTFVDWAGKRHTRSTETKNYNDAKTFKADFLESLAESSTSTQAKKMPLRDAAKTWLARKILDLSPGPRVGYTCQIGHIVANLGNLKLGQINAGVLRKFQVDLSNEGYSPGYVNQHTCRIASILAEHNLWKSIRDDFKKLKVPESAGRNFTDKEIETILGATDVANVPSYIFDAEAIFFDTGARHKEVRTMRRRGIDLNRNVFLVERETTKTSAGVREIAMTPRARQAAIRLLARAESMGSVSPDHFLFPGYAKRGSRIPDPAKPIRSLDYAWGRMRKVLKIDPGLRIHDNRHDFATELAQTNTPSAEACRLLGWTSPEMRQRYEHLKEIQTGGSPKAISQIVENRKERSLADLPKPAAPEVIQIQLRRKAS